MQNPFKGLFSAQSEEESEEEESLLNVASIAESEEEEEEEEMAPTEQQMAQYQRVKASFVANRGWMTRWASRVLETAKLLDDASTADKMMLSSITKDLESMKKKLEIIEGQASEMTLLRPEKEEEVNQIVTDTHETVRDTEIRAWRYAHTFKSTLGKEKCDDALKPKKLSKEFKPEEFSAWVKRYKEYYDSGNMAAKPMEKQRANLNSCLEPDMQCVLDSRVEDVKRAIWDKDDACIAVLKEQFMRLYPLYSRRQQFYTMECPRGQSMAEFRLKIVRAAKEANIAEMKEDDHISVKLITSCTDQKLKMKMLEMEKPTQEKLEAIIDTHESAMAGEQSLKATVERANVAGQPRRGGGARAGGNSKCGTCGRNVDTAISRAGPRRRSATSAAWWATLQQCVRQRLRQPE
jgi:hypothetical protein